MRYHIKITDNGSTVLDVDANCLFVSYHDKEQQRATSHVYIDAEAEVLARCCISAEGAIAQTLNCDRTAAAITDILRGKSK